MLLLKGTSEQALIDLINTANQLNVPLQAGGLFYGKPKAIADGYVSLNSVAQYNNIDYKGYGSFEYKRVNLTKVFGTVRPVIKVVKTAKLVDLLPLLNKAVGLSLTAKDIVDANLTWGEINSQQNLQITASETSLGYEGRFVIQCILVRPHLDTVIKKTVLPVLTHPDPIVSGKKSAGMTTWGIDFTDYIDYGTAIVQGTWRSIGQIRLMMSNKGFENWPQADYGTLAIVPTKDVPRANQLYTHVVVQPNVSTATHSGTAYFHLNIDKA